MFPLQGYDLYFEIAFISHFRKEEYADCLTPEQLGWLVELDVEFVHLFETRAKVTSHPPSSLLSRSHQLGRSI